MSYSIDHRLRPTWQQLSLKQQVAQLVVVRASGHLFDHEIRYPQWEAPTAKLRHWIEDLGVGGVILLGGSACELRERTGQMQSWSKIPLLMSADIEQGVGQRFTGATWMPPAMAFGAIAKMDLAQACDCARTMGAITAREAEAVGLNWLLGPVVDVNNNPENPVISLRSFGETPEVVIPLTEAFIQGTKDYSVLTTAKHFPGHGDTSTDPHLDLPVISHSPERLERIELAPFRSAIAAGVGAVMTAHLKVTALDADHPATFSASILTQLLRQEMAFDGLIVTDALVMQAITQHYDSDDAAVLALEAGADIILMPVDPERTIDAICNAVETGRLTPERIHQSVARIWRAKEQIFGAAWEQQTANIFERNQPMPVLTSSEAIDFCQTVISQSLKVHAPSIDNFQTVTKANVGLKNNLILVDNLLQADYLDICTPALAMPQAWGYRSQWIDSQTPAIAEITNLQPTLLQLFIQAVPFQTTSGLIELAQRWLETLIEAQRLQGLVLYGSPYVWEQLLPLLPASIPAVFSYAQIPAAQSIALEKLLGLGFAAKETEYFDPKFTT